MPELTERSSGAAARSFQNSHRPTTRKRHRSRYVNSPLSIFPRDRRVRRSTWFPLTLGQLPAHVSQRGDAPQTPANAGGLRADSGVPRLAVSVRGGSVGLGFLVIFPALDFIEDQLGLRVAGLGIAHDLSSPFGNLAV